MHSLMSSLHSPLSITFSPPKHLLLPHFKPCFFSNPYSSKFSPELKSSLKLKMSSSSSSSSQTIEHIVLFKVKDDTHPSKVDTMVKGLKGLSSIDKVLHLTAGPIHKNISESSFSFTHLLHSRYDSQEDLVHYLQHPNHLGLVQDSIFPICDDLMLIEWVNPDLNGALVPEPGSVLQVTFLKLKEGLGDSEKHEVLEITKKGFKACFPSSSIIEQTSVGENFCLEQTKGFSVASLAIFPGLSEFEAANATNQETVAAQKEKVMQYVESVVGVEYVIPSSQ